MKNKGRNWAVADVVVGLIAGVTGILGIVTGIKSSKYNEEQQYAKLEKRYGLTPKKSEGE